VKDKALMKYVGNKCVNFVRKYNPSITSYSEAKQLNEGLYKNYGHTLRGLHKVWQEEYHDDTLQQLWMDSYNSFNDIVYDADSIENLQNHLRSSEFYEQSQHIAELTLACRSKDIPVFMFSNAPNKWCEPVAQKLESLYGEKLFDDIFTPDHETFQPLLHKPDKQLYLNVEEHVQQYLHRSKSPSPTSKKNRKLLFVDDTMINLLPIINNPVWEPVIYSSGDAKNEVATRVEHPTFCSTVHSFSWLENYIKEVKTNKSKQFNLVLKGGPFFRISTIYKLLLDCVDCLSEEEASNIAEQAHATGHSLVTTCDEKSGFMYCQRLVENGLYAVLE